ncbi:DUF924 family protein [Ruixingdingia sedimenti]|uniref:DUF924 family protein n=1 Tax=Ruixingdingia sedimenti TaxID=3073604 RepID=A0ABU1F3B5_9RHOB|nr:DUF924 family protein [Xinfangfangia sp. LG-4]MDR5651342.1 DUF924 family protein [Xinfangfangia sp. LG-4]
MSDPAAVLDFWLGELEPAQWYAVDPALDDDIRARFADLWQAAAEGGLDHWIEGAAGSLAFIVLTDQFPRNMWRGSSRAFTTDALALAAARRAVAAGWDMDAPEPERQFFYLPYMHAEDAADQAECIRLIGERMPDTGAGNLLHARAHAWVIDRFGRFPYRNAAFGRATTPEEQAFLDAGAYAAAVREVQG